MATHTTPLRRKLTRQERLLDAVIFRLERLDDRATEYAFRRINGDTLRLGLLLRAIRWTNARLTYRAECLADHEWTKLGH